MSPVDVISELQASLRTVYAERDVSNYNLKKHIDFVDAVMKRNKSRFVQKEFEKMVSALIKPNTVVPAKYLGKRDVIELD